MSNTRTTTSTTLAYTTGSSLRRTRRPGPASAMLATVEATTNRTTRQPARSRQRPRGHRDSLSRSPSLSRRRSKECSRLRTVSSTPIRTRSPVGRRHRGPPVRIHRPVGRRHPWSPDAADTRPFWRRIPAGWLIAGALVLLVGAFAGAYFNGSRSATGEPEVAPASRLRSSAGFRTITSGASTCASGTVSTSRIRPPTRSRRSRRSPHDRARVRGLLRRSDR